MASAPHKISFVFMCLTGTRGDRVVSCVDTIRLFNPFPYLLILIKVNLALVNRALSNQVADKKKTK
jgi:hypothetical protein